MPHGPTRNRDITGQAWITAGIVLAGGAGSRLGGLDKPAVEVGGRRLLDRAVNALGDVPVVVVGPSRPTERPVTFVREDPAGSGPAAALAAGVAALPPLGIDASNALIAVLAADLPAVGRPAIARLVDALHSTDSHPTTSSAGTVTDGAVIVDDQGHQQLLLSVWRFSPLTAACRVRDEWADVALRQLLAPLTRVAVTAAGDEASDIDTVEQLERWRARDG